MHGYQRIEVNDVEVWRFSGIFDTLAEATKHSWDDFIDGYSTPYILGPYTLHYGNGKRIKMSEPAYETLNSILDSGRIRNRGGSNYRLSYPLRYIYDASPLNVLDTEGKYAVAVHWPLDGRGPEISNYQEFRYRLEQRSCLKALKGDPEHKGSIFKALYIRGCLADSHGWSLKPEDPLYQCMVGIKCHIDINK
jgi:hypothetical protein